MISNLKNCLVDRIENEIIGRRESRKRENKRTERIGNSESGRRG